MKAATDAQEVARIGDDLVQRCAARGLRSPIGPPKVLADVVVDEWVRAHATVPDDLVHRALHLAAARLDDHARQQATE